MAKIKEDLTGKKFWHLTVIERGNDYVRPNGRKTIQWLCECDCENHTRILVRDDLLKAGQTKSCGHLQKENNRNRAKNRLSYRPQLNDALWTIYMHINRVNGKRYVGITSTKPVERWGSNGRGYKNNKHFWGAIQKYGWENFEHKIILTGETFEYACKVERCLIKHYNTLNPEYGYNQTAGGEGCVGYKASEETKERLRQANLGKVPTKETRDKISQALTGRKKSYEERQKISERMKTAVGELNPHYGKPHTEESKQKISETNKKVWENQELRERISAANKGSNHGGVKPVYCPELNECFWGGREAYEKYGIRHIYSVKNNPNRTAGKHPITKTPLHWRDAENKDYILQLCCLLRQIINI